MVNPDSNIDSKPSKEESYSWLGNYKFVLVIAFVLILGSVFFIFDPIENIQGRAHLSETIKSDIVMDGTAVIIGNDAVNYFIQNELMDDRLNSLFLTEKGQRAIKYNYPEAEHVCASIDKDKCRFAAGKCIGSCYYLKLRE